MSKYKPKAGDRVRVVLEGEVDSTFESGDFDLGRSIGWTNSIRPTAETVISIEKVAPPVVTFKPGDILRRRDTGQLISLDSKGYTYMTSSIFNEAGRRYAHAEGGYPAEEFTSERYEKVEL